MTNKEQLQACWQEGIKTSAEIFWVKVQMEGFLRHETIVNHFDNAQEKLKYYMDTYDDDLHHNSVGDIVKIIDFGFSYKTVMNFGY